MNKLSLVDSVNTEKIGKISIVNNEIEPNLMYKDENGNQINITGEDSRFRPIHVSELYLKLKDRDWNIAKRLYISKINDEIGKDILRLKTSKSSNNIDIIDTSDESTGILFCNLEEFTETDIKDFEEEYKDILKNMKGNEIYLYSSSKKIIDVLNNITTLDVINYNSDTYTNSLSLKELVNYSSFSGISGKIDLSIQYTKSGRIICYDTTFEGFKYIIDENTNESSLVFDNFVEEVNKDVIIEYIDNVIRVIPSKSEVNECIISNCTVTYGNIG